MFEAHTEGKTEAERKKELMYNLKGSALEWYGDEIASDSSIKVWNTIKTKMIARFGVKTATPLIDAQRTKLKRDQTVEDIIARK